jgi:hypothetical protein
VGLAAVMALVFGLIPVVVLAASFHDPSSVWKVSYFDVCCAAVSIGGLVVWLVVHQATIGLISFVAADAVAAIPTLRKSITDPASESSWSFLGGVIFAGITLLTLKHLTTTGILFPLSVLVMNSFIWLFIVTKMGTKSGAVRNKPLDRVEPS